MWFVDPAIVIRDENGRGHAWSRSVTECQNVSKSDQITCPPTTQERPDKNPVKVLCNPLLRMPGSEKALAD